MATTNNFIFIRYDYSYNSPIVLKLNVIYIDGDFDWWHIKTRPIKATKLNVELLKRYAKEHTHDYICSPYDCTGSTRTRYKIKVKKGKCWLIEEGCIDC